MTSIFSWCWNCIRLTVALVEWHFMSTLVLSFQEKFSFSCWIRSMRAGQPWQLETMNVKHPGVLLYKLLSFSRIFSLKVFLGAWRWETSHTQRLNTGNAVFSVFAGSKTIREAEARSTRSRLIETKGAIWRKAKRAETAKQNPWWEPNSWQYCLKPMQCSKIKL